MSDTSEELRTVALRQRAVRREYLVVLRDDELAAAAEIAAAPRLVVAPSIVHLRLGHLVTTIAGATAAAGCPCFVVLIFPPAFSAAANFSVKFHPSSTTTSTIPATVAFTRRSVPLPHRPCPLHHLWKRAALADSTVLT